MRMHFNDIFALKEGALRPRYTVQIGSVTLSPGASFGKGRSFSGVDISEHKGKWLDVEVRGPMFVIKGVFSG